MRPPTPLMQKTPFAIDPEPMSGALTPFGGLAAVSRVFRSLKLPGVVEANLPLKQRKRGLDPSQYIESLLLLHVAGGDCMSDMQRLRDDEALEKILGYRAPSSRAVGDFLERFHDAALIDAAEEQGRQQKRLALLIDETNELQGLGRVLKGSVSTICRQRHDHPTSATVDQDATILQSHKEAARSTYDGRRGYQPMVAVWAEMGLIVADEFRDGNVPANMEPLRCARAAFAALPPTVTERYFRGDSACHEGQLLNWLRDEQREGGPQGHIGFAISARLSEALADTLKAVSERQWNTYDTDGDGTLRQWTEVDFVPNESYERKDIRPLRYIGLRLVKPQGELFADGEKKKHFAVVSNRTEDGAFILRWQRLKAGTVEHVHDELKNGLGGGQMPSGKFGANAAWFRIACIAYNVVEALRSQWPDEELRTAKLKRLRFHIFSMTGRIVRDRRKIRLRFVASSAWIQRLIGLFDLFPLITRTTG